MESIIDIIIEIVALLVLAGLTILGNRIDSFIKAKLDAEDESILDKFVTELVEAAEQMYKTDDFDGSQRLHYVEGMLVAAGYEITEAIRAKIESRVFAINTNQKKGDTK